MKLKKLLTITGAYALAAAMAVAGTVAYLTDEDSDVNVMTLGNVKIAQHEYERVVNGDGTFKTDTIDGKTSYVLKEFSQAKPLYPIVGDPSKPGDHPGYAGYDVTTVRMSQVDSYGGMDVFAGKNAQDKFVTVENTGKSDAYVRTIVAIEVGEANPALIGTSYHGTWTKNSIGEAKINGNNYMLIEYIYNGAQLGDGSWRHENGILPAGDTTYPNLSQVYLKSEVTNEDCEALDGNNNGTLDILVFSQAVQVKGFDNAVTALDAAFGDITTTNHPWTTGVKIPVIVDENEDVQELVDVLNNGNDIILDEEMDLIYEAEAGEEIDVDANGATVTLNGTGAATGDYGYLGFVPAAGEDAKVENLNVEGTGFIEVGHYGVGGGDYEVNNLTAKDFTSTLVVNDGQYKVSAAFAHYGNATLNNCVITGTKTVDATAKAYDAGFVNKTNTVINGGEFGSMYIWAQAHVTINDAKVGTIDSATITNKNLGMLTIGAGAEVDTINIVCLDKYTPALTIEAGATVGKIIYKGVTYTQAEWLAR